MRRICVAAVTAASVVSMSAQGLSKEIVVDKDIVVEQLEVSPLRVRPQLVTDAVGEVRLDWNRAGVGVDGAVEVWTLPPSLWRTAVDAPDWRGYVRGGYFPGFQVDLNAGYRLVERENMRLDAWGQYSGLSYKNKLGGGADGRLSNNDVTVGGRYRWTPLKSGVLSVDAAYRGSSYTMPRDMLDGNGGVYDGFRQTVSDAGMRVGWEHVAGGVTYGVRAGLERFEWGHGAEYGRLGGDRYKAMSQTSADVKGWFNVAIRDNWRGSVDVGWRGLMSPGGWMLGPDGGVWMDKCNSGVADVRPSVIWKRGGVRVRMGAYVAWLNVDGGGVKVYPDVRADFGGKGLLAAYVAVGGGDVRMNGYSELYGRTRYVNPSMLPLVSREKMSLRGGVTVGPVRGVSLSVFASSGKWSNVVTMMGGDGVMAGNYCQRDMSSLWGGAELRYDGGDVVRVKCGYRIAANGRERGCADWLDGARGVLDAGVDVRPAKGLLLGAGYGMRSGRHVLTVDGERLSLGVARDVYVHGVYEIDSRWRAEVSVHNLTCARWQEAWGVVNPGVRGFVGITYLF